MLLHVGHYRFGGFPVERGKGTEHILSAYLIGQNQREHGGAAARGVRVGAFEAYDALGGIGGIGQLFKLLLCDVCSKHTHVLWNHAAGEGVQRLAGADHRACTDARDDLGVRMGGEGCLNGELSIVGHDSIAGGNDLKLAVGFARQPLADTFLALEQDPGRRITDQTICSDLQDARTWIYLYNGEGRTILTGITTSMRRSLHMYKDTTVYIGMDVHKESFTLSCFVLGEEDAQYVQTIPSDYILVVKYANRMRKIYGEESEIICGYEAGCLGFSLYHQLTGCGMQCVILAPTTMMEEKGKKRIKTDKRDAKKIAKCLAFHTYRPVHIPTDEDEQVKEYIRMRNDLKAELKRVKQQTLAFCQRHGLKYTLTKSHWTQAHLKWLRALRLDGLYRETLDEYLLHLSQLTEKLERMDRRIEEMSYYETYRESVDHLTCFMGIKRPTALSVMVEVGDFKRFATAQHFASYLGLVPGEASSGEGQTRLGITKAGNSLVRKLLIEAANSYGRGRVGYKSAVLKARQQGNPPQIIAYADRGQ